jgi:uncharacterized PurR-regulated membrane protein YhhQ (DUF165 family)
MARNHIETELLLASYAGVIWGANVMITLLGVIPVGFGLMAPAGVVMAGLALAIRDALQERGGRSLALLGVAIGAGLSAFLSGPLALASGAAFLVSELADMAVYTPLRRRSVLAAVALSNTVGAVIDSIVFLWLAFGSLDFLAGNVYGKIVMTLPVLVLIWVRGRKNRPRQELRAARKEGRPE